MQTIAVFMSYAVLDAAISSLALVDQNLLTSNPKPLSGGTRAK